MKKSIKIGALLLCMGVHASSAFAATATATFTVTAKVGPGTCTIASPNSLDFGTIPAGSTTGPYDSNVDFTVNCSNALPYNVGLNNGTDVSGSRMMQPSAGVIKLPYELYSDTTRTTRWNDYWQPVKVSKTGTGTNQTFTVFGRIPGPTPVLVVGTNYSDTITATVFW